MAKTLCFQEVRRDFGHAVSSFIVFVPVQPFSADADLLAPFQPELFLHHCTEMRLMPRNAACHSAQAPDLWDHKGFSRSDAKQPGQSSGLFAPYAEPRQGVSEANRHAGGGMHAGRDNRLLPYIRLQSHETAPSQGHHPYSGRSICRRSMPSLIISNSCV